MKPLHVILGVFSGLPIAGCFSLAVASVTSPIAASAEDLARLVDALVERDDLVGAELLVTHRGKPVLHRAFGWRDREMREPMERDTLFAVRSMTKPITGMAAQLLVDEGRLALDTPVADILPAFDTPASRGVTVRHLLTHRGGFPTGFAADAAKGLADFRDLRELADLSGARGPEFLPGSRFLYSDVGSDVLGAVVAAVAGESLEAVIERRILAPLGMNDTFPEAEVTRAGRASRVATRYGGLPGDWTPYWSPAQAPLHAFLRGSGGLYSTPRDYARFLQHWLAGVAGRPDGATPALLSFNGFVEMLAPESRDTMDTGFVGATTDYARMWMVYRARGAGEGGTPFGFGHGGSDGTHAYAFPEHDVVVCFFTQTRGHATRATFEAALSHLLLRPERAAWERLLTGLTAARDDLAEFTGLYSPDGTAASLAAIVAWDGALAFESPGRLLMRLRPTEDRDHWTPERAPTDAIRFHRESGRISAMTMERDGQPLRAERFRPQVDLPTVDELMTLRGRVASPERWAALLPLRINGLVETPAGSHRIVTTHDAQGRALTQMDLGAAGVMRVWVDGDRVWREMPGESAAVELRGQERAEFLDGTLVIALGDWRRHYREVTVLARERSGEDEVFRVRLTPREGLATTKLVHAETGAVVVEEGFVLFPGAGLQGVTARHTDFREVEGVWLAHVSDHAPRRGPAEARFRLRILSVEPRVKLADDALRAPLP